MAQLTTGSTTIALGPGLVLLTATGFADSYTFIQHGHVFAEAMTGNLVLVAIGSFDSSVVEYWRPLLTYLAFLVGVAIAWVGLRSLNGRDPGRFAQLTTLAAEIVIFLVIATLPASFPQLVVSMAIALGAGSQIAVFRNFGGQSLTSTVMTTNSFKTVFATLDAVASHRSADVSSARIALLALGSFVVGAFVGAGASDAIGNTAAVCGAVLFAVVLAWLLVRPRADE